MLPMLNKSDAMLPILPNQMCLTIMVMVIVMVMVVVMMVMMAMMITTPISITTISVQSEPTNISG